MNTVMGFVAIVSLLLALASGGGTAEEQVGVSFTPAKKITSSKLATNHNETLVSDTAPMK